MSVNSVEFVTQFFILGNGDTNALTMDRRKRKFTKIFKHKKIFGFIFLLKTIITRFY